MMRLLTWLLLLPVAVLAQADAGYQHFYNLEFPEALAAFRAEAAANPGSPDAYNHVAHAILYREMFRSGALESELVTGSNPFLRREG
ncbi:MAG: hypothetical protein M3O20_09145, partial [Acidobacteriota bacterium]|nr:hypothetical protein [Acidobacteriota bacterium]